MNMLTWAETDSNTLTISQWDPESSPGEYFGMDNDDHDDDDDELTYEHHRCLTHSCSLSWNLRRLHVSERGLDIPD